MCAEHRVLLTLTQRGIPIVFHVRCIWPLHPTGQTHWDTHTRIHKQTHLHSYAETDRGGKTKINRSLLFLPFHSVHALSLFLPLQLSVFHNVLNLSAGHSCDTSKSLLLAKCQRMKWQQTHRPWNKYRNVFWKCEAQGRKDKVRKTQICNLEDQSKMQRCKKMSKTQSPTWL